MAGIRLRPSPPGALSMGACQLELIIVHRNGANPVMAVYNNELYAAWAESNGSVNQIRVRKYNGTSWSFVDGTNGLNEDSTKNALHPTLIVFNGHLYAAWDEMNGSYTAIRVRRYDGSNWTQVDGDTAQGLNRVATLAANPTMAVIMGNCIWPGIRWSIR